MHSLTMNRRDFTRSLLAVGTLVAVPGFVAAREVNDGPFQRWVRLHGLEPRRGETAIESMKRCWNILDDGLVSYTGPDKLYDLSVRHPCIAEFWETERELLHAAFGKALRPGFPPGRWDRFGILKMLRASPENAVVYSNFPYAVSV